MGELTHEDKTFAIIGCCMGVHRTRGAGYLEAVYQGVLAALLPEHYAQVLNYLKATGKKIGLLVNFSAASLQWKRLVF